MSNSSSVGLRWSVERTPVTTRKNNFKDLVAAGLSKEPKALPPLLLYDARGSELFEKIRGTGDYYVSRAEKRLLEARKKTIAESCEPVVTMVELGSGSGEKTAILLGALIDKGHRVRYVPVDISESALVNSAQHLESVYPSLEIHGMAGEYHWGIDRLRTKTIGQCLTVFLGGNIGNLDRKEAITFLARIKQSTDERALILLGADLEKKDPRVLERAYDDAQGVTAMFNMNLLHRMNTELGANFDLSRFRHRARWNPDLSRIEMHLESLEAQSVHFEELDQSFDFAKGETIHTESSHKPNLDSLKAMAYNGGWNIRENWVDTKTGFSLNLLSPQK